MKTKLGLLAGLSILASTSLASAQADWPRKAVTLIVPYAPGGYTDAVGRITARYLEKALATSVVVENRAGAGGIIGTAYVAKAPPDGYTLCVCSVGATSVAPVAQKTDYDPKKDLRPISIVSTIPQTVIVGKSLPITSIPELIAYAKANPGKLNYGSSGAGGLMHYSVALFQVRTGTRMTHVPFKGGAPATAAVVSGEVQISFTNMTDALPQMEANTVRAIAVTSVERSPYAPNLPTVAEAGNLKGYSAESWNGIIAPAGTPEPIIKKISDALAKMVDDADVKKSMAAAGATGVFTTPAEFAKRIDDELAQWAVLVKEMKDGK
ncbi:MAG: tripartite tricarboxylate transporter substrate binding protein [Beijerinckiaceae bacterium]|nr:tripartite tricarboxylate transporter substrate binding protein [Beijerinckiaceae bacterium]